MQPTQQAVEVATNVAIPSSQHVSSVQPSRENEPSKNFVFGCAGCFPQPFERHMRLHVSEVKGIVLLSFEFCCSLGVRPNVFALSRNILFLFQFASTQHELVGKLRDGTHY